MKKSALSSLLALLLLCVAMSACTHNNGNIGPLFGNWKLLNIATESGEERTLTGNYFWAFQSTTIKITDSQDDLTSSHSIFGNFRLEDNTLFLTFFEDESHDLAPTLGLPLQSELQVLSLKSKEMRLAYTDEQSKVWVYTFKKW